MLVPFPIAFFIGAFLADIAYLTLGDPFWATAAAWLIGAGLVGAALAALAGFTDFLGEAVMMGVIGKLPRRQEEGLLADIRPGAGAHALWIEQAKNLAPRTPLPL